jgi:hypothetical protein
MRTFNEWALDRCDEGFFDSLKKGYGQGYQQARQGVEQNYDRYADAARQALSKAGGVVKTLSQKTGVPLPLATALVAAGITGGPTAVPFAALLYFVKQPLMKGANKAFDATWDAGAKVAGRAGQAVAPAQALKPAMESFRNFVEADNWGDWAGETLGGAAGRVAGGMAGYGQKIAGALGQRAKEIGQWAKGDPKEAARMLFLVGAGAAIGAGVGRLTHDLQDMIIQKIRDHGIPQEELAWLRSNVILNKQSDGSYGTERDSLMSTKKDTYDAYSSMAQEKGTKIASQTSIADNAGAGGSGEGFVDTSVSRNDAGAVGVMSADVTPGVFSGLKPTGKDYSDMGDAYRDIAVAMHGSGDHAGSMIGMIKGSGRDGALSVDGPGAAAEIRRRLASPDTYTSPAAVAGGLVGGTGNERRRK